MILVVVISVEDGFFPCYVIVQSDNEGDDLLLRDLDNARYFKNCG